MRKILCKATSALILAVMFMLGGGRIADAQAGDRLSWVLPAGLKTGVNLGFPYGPATHRFAKRTIDHTYGTNPAIAWSNPYINNRLDLMLDESDFEMIAGSGFGHVRILLDPLAMDMFESSSDPMVVSSTARFWPHLMADIKEAQDQGLYVILDFHPFVMSLKHFRDWSLRYREEQVLPSDFDANFQYRGTYKYHFLDPAGGDNTNLARFWDSFTAELQNRLGTAEWSSVNSDRIAFELLNEPFEDIYNSASAGLRLPWVEVTSWSWRNVAMVQWRSTAISALKKVQARFPRSHVLVTNFMSSPETAFDVPFAPIQLLVDGVTEVRTIVYVWHFYEPLSFTHRVGGEKHYYYERDWLGTHRSASMFAFPPYFDQQALKSPYDCDRMPWVQADYVPYGEVDDGDQDHAKETNDLVKDWVAGAKAVLGQDPKVGITEFGCLRRNWNGNHFLEDPPYSPPSPDERSLNRERSHWVFDTRTYIQSQLPNSGWTYFDYVSPEWRAFEGDEYLSTSYYLRGERGKLQPHIEQALFGSTREP